ncbi:MAG: energy transducer TonB [Bdellovibrionaceae bacterium]|nr:energy transducer TonB [Pseudobdellovibrionaceae bacterium]
MRILYGILLSLIVHFTLVFILGKASPYFETIPKDVTEIEIITPDKEPEVASKPNRQIVRDALAPEKELKEDDEDLARFLSQNRQRVRKETQAANSGITKNRAASKQDKKADNPNSKPTSEAMKPKASAYDPDNIIQRTLNERSSSAFDEAPSTNGDAMPNDVSVGSFTALNTDRYMYYSFFARIEDLIRFRWESRVRQAIDSYDRGYQLSVLGTRNWVTGIDIWITPDGRFHSAHIMKESGIKKFDTAAAAAFREAGMFPNPPQEMVEDDGYIHLKYSFNVRFQPSTLVYQQ